MSVNVIHLEGKKSYNYIIMLFQIINVSQSLNI